MIRARKTPYKLRKLLVIDDDEKLIGYYRELLTPYGFEVLVAFNGEQAIPLVETNPDIQLVILDLSMPRMDGRQWLRWFRTKSKDSPVIIITGYKLEPADEDLHPWRNPSTSPSSWTWSACSAAWAPPSAPPKTLRRE